MQIHCGNLPFSFDDMQLQSTFAEFGTVESCSIVIHKYTGESRGFGFVTMPQRDEAMAAITELDGKEIDGRTIRVCKARPERKLGS